MAPQGLSVMKVLYRLADQETASAGRKQWRAGEEDATVHIASVQM